MINVSVIIPVYNNSNGLNKLLNALVNQSYPKEFFEIIVVDNGSNDGSLGVAQKYEYDHKNQVQVLIEESVRSSYAARNKGISKAQGQIIAMIDSDCMPLPDWVEKGVNALDTLNADLLGGSIKFVFQAHPVPAEMYDSIASMQMKYTIPSQGTAANANLFVRRVVFNTIGLFPPTLESGGDIIWTKTATKHGFKMEYSPEVEVLHPTRKLKELLRKQYRVGKGHLAIWKNQKCSKFRMFSEIFRYLFPPRFESIKMLVIQRGTSDMEEHLISIWLIAWYCRVAKNLGRISRMLSSDKNRSKFQ